MCPMFVGLSYNIQTNQAIWPNTCLLLTSREYMRVLRSCIRTIPRWWFLDTWFRFRKRNCEMISMNRCLTKLVPLSQWSLDFRSNSIPSMANLRSYLWRNICIHSIADLKDERFIKKSKMLQNQLTSARVIKTDLFFLFVGFYAIILPTFTFLFTSMCFTESIYQLKSEPKEMRRQKKRTKNKILRYYCMLNLHNGLTALHSRAHYISFHFYFL